MHKPIQLDQSTDQLLLGIGMWFGGVENGGGEGELKGESRREGQHLLAKPTVEVNQAVSITTVLDNKRAVGGVHGPLRRDIAVGPDEAHVATHNGAVIDGILRMIRHRGRHHG